MTEDKKLNEEEEVKDEDEVEVEDDEDQDQEGRQEEDEDDEEGEEDGQQDYDPKVAIRDQGEFIVEDIVDVIMDHTLPKTQWSFQVRWAGYEDSFDE
jgi:hypothetical protein